MGFKDQIRIKTVNRNELLEKIGRCSKLQKLEIKKLGNY